MAANNLFRHNEFNANKEASPGFFEDNGRVKPIKLQGVPSEGFIMPIDSLYKWLDFIGESHEGIVIRIENGLSEAYKLKCFRFLGEESKSLDKGEIDIEADQ